MILAGAFLKGFWELDGAGAEVPEEDPEGVDVHRVVVLSCGTNTEEEESGWVRAANYGSAAFATITRRWPDATSGRTGKQLRGHVNGGPDDAARHHGLWFTEAQVSDLRPVLLVQLEKELEQIEHGFMNREELVPSEQLHLIRDKTRVLTPRPSAPNPLRVCVCVRACVSC